MDIMAGSGQGHLLWQPWQLSAYYMPVSLSTTLLALRALAWHVCPQASGAFLSLLRTVARHGDMTKGMHFMSSDNMYSSSIISCYPSFVRGMVG